ncbi:MAG: hypothetical protein RIF34_11215 [Candidatus Kapaibacterium sp.]
MIKTIYFIILLALTFGTSSLVSQVNDSTAQVEIYSELVSPDTLMLQFSAIRLTDSFLTNWANSTFMVAFDDNIDFNNIGVVEHPNQLDIPYKNPANQSFGAYTTQIDIANDRIAFGYLGPYTKDSTVFIPLRGDTAVVLGRYYVYTKDRTPFPRGSTEEEDGVRFQWKSPVEYYQDFAFKTELPIDSLTVAGWFLEDDNVPAVGDNYNTVLFKNDNSSRPRMILEYFRARYSSNLKVVCEWKTRSEAFNKGFIIKRGLMPFDETDPEVVEYDTEVADYRQPQNAFEMTGLGTRSPGKSYRYRFDTVSFRNYVYCYELLYQDDADNILSLAKSCVNIPNAVLTYLQANPNPASKIAQVEYTVEDDVYLTCGIYDLIGRKILSVYEDEFVGIGTHTFSINLPENLAIGMYDIIMIAIPINDTSVEKSTGVFKLQVIK